MSEESENSLLTESNKWNKFERNVLLMIGNCKNDCKREDELVKSLEEEVDNINNSMLHLTEEFNSESYNKYFSTHDIFKLEGLSDQITDSCNEVRTLLETCNKLQQKCKSNIDVFRDKLCQQKNSNKDMLKLQNKEIEKLRNEIRNSDEVLIAEKERQSLELVHIKNLQEETKNKLELLKCDQYSESDMCKYDDELIHLESEKFNVKQAIQEKKQLKESISASTTDLQVNTNREIEVLNEKINVMLKKYNKDNLDIDECKKLIEEQEESNSSIFETYIKLKLESKSIQEKSSELDQLAIEEEKRFLQSNTELKNSINALIGDIQNKKEVLLKERETENACSQTVEDNRNDLERKEENLNSLNSNLDNLHIRKNNLIELNNKEMQSIETYSKRYEQSSTHIQNLKTDIKELLAAISNFTLEQNNTTENLKKEINEYKLNTDMKNTELEVAKLKYYVELDVAQSNEITNYEAEKIKLENEIGDMKKLIDTMKEQTEQASLNLESRTLECDILSRRIKTGEGVQKSLNEELKPKPILNQPFFIKKRYRDELSDSSFDGNIPFPQRVLMKRQKMRKSKTSPTK